jgi:hypothetical protein
VWKASAGHKALQAKQCMIPACADNLSEASAGHEALQAKPRLIPACADNL